jgi:AraC-like DNA-binding protein
MLVVVIRFRVVLLMRYETIGDVVSQPSAQNYVHRAHVTGANAPSPPIFGYEPSIELRELIRSYWIPVWEMQNDVVQTQRVLQYPVCLLVIASDYERFYGVVTGLSTVELSGSGWAFGVTLQPGAGRLVWERSISTLTDRFVPITDLPNHHFRLLPAHVRKIMNEDPLDPLNHRGAIALIEEVVAQCLSIDDEGRLINAIVERIETDRSIVAVDQMAALENISERTLQRLTRDRLGLSPKWLIQRRRLHDAVENIKSGQGSLADLANRLGYTDQAHFTRDFKRVIGMTPGAYALAQTSA